MLSFILRKGGSKMSKLFLSAVPLFLMASQVLAAAGEDAANAPPQEPVSMIYVVLFLIAFFGMIIGFLGYMWWADKQKKAKGNP
jgi:hypothetical protein